MSARYSSFNFFNTTQPFPTNRVTKCVEFFTVTTILKSESDSGKVVPKKNRGVESQVRPKDQFHQQSQQKQ